MEVASYDSLEGLWLAFTDACLREWREEYWPRTSLEDAFARHVRTTTFGCKRYPGGIYHLSYKVRAREPQQDEWYFAKVTAVGGMYLMH